MALWEPGAKTVPTTISPTSPGFRFVFSIKAYSQCTKRGHKQKYIKLQERYVCRFDHYERRRINEKVSGLQRLANLSCLSLQILRCQENSKDTCKSRDDFCSTNANSNNSKVRMFNHSESHFKTQLYTHHIISASPSMFTIFTSHLCEKYSLSHLLAKIVKREAWAYFQNCSKKIIRKCILKTTSFCFAKWSTVCTAETEVCNSVMN